MSAVVATKWETTAHTTHISCGGPVRGQRIRFCRKGKDEAIEATVALHWHYDGCIIDIEMTDECGTTINFSFHPDMGDLVEVLK